MKKCVLKRRLNKAEIPPYEPERLKETVMQAEKTVFHPERFRMGNIRFFLNQMRFIRKETWGLKLAVTFLGIVCIARAEVGADSWLWPLAAILGPALCLVNANEICDIYQPGMLELQMTAKHSLKQIFMIRCILFGIMDFLAFLLLTVVLTGIHEADIWKIILYSAVPYQLMCVGCLMILNRKQEENALLYCITWGCFLICGIVCLKISGAGLFTEKNVVAWKLTAIVVTTWEIWEIVKLQKQSGGNIDEINVGTINEAV